MFRQCQNASSHSIYSRWLNPVLGYTKMHETWPPGNIFLRPHEPAPPPTSGHGLNSRYPLASSFHISISKFLLAQKTYTEHEALLSYIVEMLSCTWVQSTIANINPAPTRRKRWTCHKRTLTDCPRSQKASNCKNGCCDCGRVNCQGQNAKQLHEMCFEGWE